MFQGTRDIWWILCFETYNMGLFCSLSPPEITAITGLPDSFTLTPLQEQPLTQSRCPSLWEAYFLWGAFQCKYACQFFSCLSILLIQRSIAHPHFAWCVRVMWSANSFLGESQHQVCLPMSALRFLRSAIRGQSWYQWHRYRVNQ